MTRGGKQTSKVLGDRALPTAFTHNDFLFWTTPRARGVKPGPFRWLEWIAAFAGVGHAARIAPRGPGFRCASSGLRDLFDFR